MIKARFVVHGDIRQTRGGIGMLQAGTKAPDFTLVDQTGAEVGLSAYAGKKIVIYFYSKDNTSGCTRQAQAFAGEYGRLRELGAEVVGISKDSAESHARFAEKYGLPFTLLADPEHTALQAYDVWKEKVRYGKKVMSTVRATYVIDENGIIEKVWPSAKPDTNAAEVLEYLSAKERD